MSAGNIASVCVSKLIFSGEDVGNTEILSGHFIAFISLTSHSI
jgi:hypothetical protein